MPLDHYVTLGRSGLRVSPMCLGAMTFGEDLGWGSSVKDSEAIIDAYLARGGNFIDTANVYTLGHSEQIIGDHIGRESSRREKVVIATKFFSNHVPGDPNGGGAGAKGLYGAVHASLKRLQTDYVDLLWMHAWDSNTPIEETMRALDDLVRAGKVRYIGFSDTPAWKVAQAQVTAHFRSWAPLVALQIEYNLLERTVEGELIPMARELGLGVTPWSPLKGGVLTGKYTRANANAVKADRGAWVTRALGDRTYDLVDALIAMAKEMDTTPSRVAIAWVQSRPGVTSTIIGARTMDQLDQNLAALDLKLTDAQVQKLNALTEPQLGFPNNFLKMAPMFMHPGLTVNGVTAPANPGRQRVEKKA